MNRLFLLFCTLALVGMTPFQCFAYDGYDPGTDYDEPEDRSDECVPDTYTCRCGTEGGSNSSASATSTASACDTYCSQSTQTSYTYSCSLSDGTANYTVGQGAVGSTTGSETPETTTETEEPDYLTPTLLVDIPGFDGFSAPTANESVVSVNFIGEYINAVYGWILGAAALVAVVMMMLGGLQYVLSRGKPKYIEKAKTRITNAITGIVLLLAAYNIAYLIDPRLVDFNALTLQKVSEIQLAETVKGYEGSGSYGAFISGPGAWKSISEPYFSIVQTAKEKGSCSITDGFSSPTGRLPNQGGHHWFDPDQDGIWSNITALDWAAPWGQAIAAPFDGTVTYEQQTQKDNPCGNRIYLQSNSGTTITICHTKDFTDDEGNFEKTRTVTRGETIGHLGGVCCSGTVPNGWLTSCSNTGTLCTDPTKDQSCTCQKIQEAGNTTGPHVHVTWSGSDNILACLE